MFPWRQLILAILVNFGPYNLKISTLSLDETLRSEKELSFLEDPTVTFLICFMYMDFMTHLWTRVVSAPQNGQGPLGSKELKDVLFKIIL